ncbi:VCBS repeat-containing protein [Adhaeribacter swui]|uniref:VCBS repeat-containing protein n=1 Tax=Adhaeribacter swui TaxID=2086471 RepID=A0A7G7G2T3_9BACT|nr:VCBS repeat-containing protein [Adhaeribacter swui]QNF31467.1 VCBS repeat-containing protein [Adhaeribacter swui]
MRFVFWLSLWVLLSVSCTPKKNTPGLAVSGKELQQILPDSNETAALDGNSLAHVYCSACHQFPEPALLPKYIWEKNVLPVMGHRLGIGADLSLYTRLSTPEIMALIKADIYPSKALIAKKDWIKIQEYYQTQAPEKLAAPELLRPDSLTLFRASALPINKSRNALTSLLQYEPTTQELLIGDRRNKLFHLNHQLSVVDSIQLDTPPVAAIRQQNGQYQVLTAGSLNPSDAPYGRLYSWNLNNSAGANPILQLSDLQRPVHLASSDLNQDNLLDLIICQYGNQIGKLSWFEAKEHGTYQEHILKKIPGSRQVIIRDLNHDNRPDIVALFAQAAESVIVFYNQGQGRFTEELLVQLPPVYGASYLELVDFNHDGAEDLLLTNGDNGDYSFVLKPYHGIRLFLNNKENKFKEAVFLPLPGATQAVARDFDQDGDVDIAAIAYFADFMHQPETGFVYYENKGNNIFRAQTTLAATQGRWLTLTTGDLDQDGDEDIMLGSFIFATTPVPPLLQEQWLKNGPSVLLLKNQLQPKLQ